MRLVNDIPSLINGTPSMLMNASRALPQIGAYRRKDRGAPATPCALAGGWYSCCGNGRTHVGLWPRMWTFGPMQPPHRRGWRTARRNQWDDGR